MSYAGSTGRAPAAARPASLLPFLGLALVLSAVRVLATVAALAAGPSTGAVTSATQTTVFAGIWIAGYFAEAVAGWLLWRNRLQPYGRAAMVLLWITLGVQALRLLNLLGSRLTATVAMGDCDCWPTNEVSRGCWSESATSRPASMAPTSWSPTQQATR